MRPINSILVVNFHQRSHLFLEGPVVCADCNSVAQVALYQLRPGAFPHFLFFPGNLARLKVTAFWKRAHVCSIQSLTQPRELSTDKTVQDQQISALTQGKSRSVLELLSLRTVVKW